MDLALKVFLAEKCGEKGSVFQVIGMYFHIGMRILVFFWKTVNSRYLKVEVHLKLLIFQTNCSQIIYFEISQFEIHGIKINILMFTNGYKWLDRKKGKLKAPWTIANLAKLKQVIQSTAHVSNTDILKYSHVSKDTLDTFPIFISTPYSQTAGISK